MLKIFKSKKQTKKEYPKKELDNDKKIIFGDINFQTFIKNLLNKKENDIYQSEVYYIDELNFKGWPLLSIRGIEFFKNLRVLNLYNSHISNTSFFKYLENLEDLDMSWNDSLSEISCLINNSNLKSLAISYCSNVNDLKVLENFSNLQMLDISENKITNTSFINGLQNIKKVIISKNNITEIDLNTNLNKIEFLDISANRLRNLNFLKNMPNIKYLDISANFLEDISYLTNLEKLEYLDVRGKNNKKSIKETLKQLKSKKIKILK